MRTENAAICDDIRTENTGKLILVGVYQENILVTKFPTQFRLAAWAEIRVDRNGDIPIEFRILRNRKPLVHGGGILNVRDFTQRVAFTTPPMPIELDSECALSFQLRETGQKWHTLKKLAVKLREEHD